MTVRKFAHVNTPIPGPESKRLLDEWKDYEADKTGYQAQVSIDHGKGAMLFDADQNSFLDFTSGVLVTNTGHCHPKLVEAVSTAAGRMLNVYEYCTDLRVEAAKALVDAAPEHLDRCFFLSTGSEAVDSAIRIMKRAKNKFEIISFYGGFHGRIQSVASYGGLAKTKKGYGPSTPGAIRVPYPYCYRCPFHSTPEKCSLMCLEFMDEAVRANSVGSIAGLVAEPYMGTAGFIFPPEGYLKALEKWTRSNDILFTLDEVQASYGRTGNMWAMEGEELTPDIVTVGKGIGGGISVSAILMRKELIDKALGKGELGSTYGGNPVSCAAVSAVLDIFREEKIVEHCREIGIYFAQRMNKLAEKYHYVGDVRGTGLVYGIEFVKDKKTKEPYPEAVKAVIDRCASKGLLTGSVGIFGNVLRVAPPLVITQEQAEEGLDILEEVLESL